MVNQSESNSQHNQNEEDKMMNPNPWHTLPLHRNSPEIINVLIEIPKGERAKYEIDKETGMLKLDRVVLPSMQYPSNYGFIPKTYADDKDPLDVLVLCQVSIEPLCLVEARTIGVLRMVDSGDYDDKIIAVAAKDVTVNYIKDIEDMPEYLRNEIAHFFAEYKSMENKKVTLEGYRNKEEACQIINDSIEMYISHFVKQNQGDERM